MDNACVIVRVIERVTQLADPLFQLSRLKDFSLLIHTQTRECVAVHVFHRNAAVHFVMNEVVNSNDVLMSELQAPARLAFEVAQHRAIVND